MGDFRTVTSIKASLASLAKSLSSLTYSTDPVQAKELTGSIESALGSLDKFLPVYTNGKEDSFVLPLSGLIGQLRRSVVLFERETEKREARSITRKQLAATIRDISHKLSEREKSSDMSVSKPEATTSISTPPPAAAAAAVIEDTKPDVYSFYGLIHNDIEMIFSHLSLLDILNSMLVCQQWRNILDRDPSIFRFHTLKVVSKFFTRKQEPKSFPVKVSSNDPKLIPEVVTFLERRGTTITKFHFTVSDFKEISLVLKMISPRVTELKFSFTEPSEPVWSDDRFWASFLDCPRLSVLNLHDTKTLRNQVPSAIKEKVAKIIYPPFIHNAYACYDYNHPDQSKEFFSFKAGDKFQLLPSSRDLQGWKIAINENGEKGFVPGNYLVLLSEKK